MDVMGKLFTLFQDCNNPSWKWFPNNAEMLKLIEYLVANGVTVQERVPSEEPPKEYRDEYGELIPFLVCEEGTDYPFRAMYDGKTCGDGIFAIPVKWWMHLPAPPKGKEREDGDGNV